MNLDLELESNEMYENHLLEDGDLSNGGNNHVLVILIFLFLPRCLYHCMQFV